MKLSVVLPCFNGAQTIAVQLDALTRQSYRGEWEVVVVNNGSTDDSMTIVERYHDRLPGLRIVDAYAPPGPRKGVTHSYSVGFAAASGDAFVLCEADDEVGDGWLSAMGEALERHELVAAALEYRRLNPAWMLGSWEQQSAKEGLSTISGPLHLPYASGCSLGLRRAVYERIGDPDEKCAASWDTDYCWRAHQAGIAIQFAPDAVIHYRLRTGYRDAYRQGLSWAKAHAVLNDKYAPRGVRITLLKRELRTLRDLARHGLAIFGALRSRGLLRAWFWGLGWSIGDVKGARYESARFSERKQLSAENLGRLSQAPGAR
jgi:GT2 family glycosyltransferase